MSKREIILYNFPDEDFLFADGYDEAIIGVSSKLKIVYSYSKIIDILKKDMNIHEAIEYFDFNIEGAYVGEKTPIYLYDDIFI